MNAKYWQRGETLDYTPTAAVANGAVVRLGTRIGIAGSDIAANASGQIHGENIHHKTGGRLGRRCIPGIWR